MPDILSEDRALLRRFEPIIRFTRGESFFPMDVDRYLDACSFWVHRPNHPPLRLWPEGELDETKLTEPRYHGQDAVYYLKFIEPLNLTEMALLQIRQRIGLEKDNRFRAGWGRLARVGYLSRFVDAMFSLSLLARGRVPGDTALAARVAYQRMMAEAESYRYYGRVVRQNGWIALQYWFFYAFNNWRSGFYGANDHEGDWEMIYVYLYEADGDLHPEWVAYASHDFSGDDLRRRWDDPELVKVGEHPVIYAAAGSHAGYFQPGEYLAEIELPLVEPLTRSIDGAQQIWERLVPPANPAEARKWSDVGIFRVPFVDYARGDGFSIGPGQENRWAEPGLLHPTPDWAARYRGLWGWYARDPLSGENAPAGPLYNRDGSVRRSWYDPLGWSGLDKVPPRSQRLDLLLQQQAENDQRRAALLAELERKSEALQRLGETAVAVRGRPHLKPQQEQYEQQITELAAEIAQLRRDLAAGELLAEALDLHEVRVLDGLRGPARAHIRRAHHPASDAGLRLNRFAEAWAALSVGMFMVGFVILVLFAREYLLFGLAGIISLIVFIEASVRQRLTRLITSLTIGLAIVAALVLFFEFFWELVILNVLVAGSYIIGENLRELRR